MTLFELPATEQEIFDIVANHLLTQNKKSLLKPYAHIDYVDGICAYRGIDDCKCAAGILIPDEHYSSTMETGTWNALVEKELVPDKFRYFIRELQSIHDKSPVTDWKENLKNLANSHNLEWKFS